MLIYWLMFAYVALFALGSAPRERWSAFSAGQGAGLLGFFVLYFLVAALRFETGGDWFNYEGMYEDIRYSTLGDAMTQTDTLFGALMWLSAQLGLGLYLPDAVCAGLLCYGTLRVAGGTREPWLGVLTAVPYILIVVGMGYVRQAGAIGLILMALAHLDRPRSKRLFLYLLLAIGFHSTAAIVLPLFGYALSARNRAAAILAALFGGALLFFFLGSRLQDFQENYLEAEFSSSGAAVRVAMNVLPSLLFLARRKAVPLTERMLSFWTLVAFANLAFAFALGLTPSSTWVDRLALYFSIIQIFAFGEIQRLSGFSPRNLLPLRFAVIALSGLVQVVWLVYAVNAEFWVPYKSVLRFL